jgi:uncharacterized protein (TIGR03437 family)
MLRQEHKGAVVKLNVAHDASGGFTVTLTSDNPLLTPLQPSVTISAGSPAIFQATAGTIPPPGSTADITACDGSSICPTWPIQLVLLVGLNCDQTSLSSSQTTNCTVTISGPAPTGGFPVTLTSDNPLLPVQSSVTIPAGSISASFQATAGAISTSGLAVITACDSGSNCQTLTIPTQPQMFTLSCDQTSLSSGQTTNCTVTLSAAGPDVKSALRNTRARSGAPMLRQEHKGAVVKVNVTHDANGGFTVTLMSDNPMLPVPPSVTIPAGSMSASFPATAGMISTAGTADIMACDSNNNCQTWTIQLVLLVGLNCDQTSLSSSQTTNCTVTISGPAPTGGFPVTLTSDTSMLPVPPSVTIPAGSTSASFQATAGAISTPGMADITACDSNNNCLQPVPILLTPQVILVGLNCDQTSLSSQQSTSCTVTISGPAPDATSDIRFANPRGSEVAMLRQGHKGALERPIAAQGGKAITQLPKGGRSEAVVKSSAGHDASGGFTIMLTTDNPLLTVQSPVTIAPGSTSNSFTATAGNILTNSAANITACDSNNNCLPPTAIQLSGTAVIGLVCDPSLSSGQTANCTVSISAAAPNGGFTVTLTSDNPLLPVPPSVTVPAGSIDTIFQATAGTISTAGPADITACDSNCQTATIQLMPLPLLTSLTCDQSSLSSGQLTNCTVTISAPAPDSSSEAPMLRRGRKGALERPIALQGGRAAALPPRGGRSEVVVKSSAEHDTSGGFTVTLTSDNPLLTVAVSVTIPAGSTSTIFQATAGAISTLSTADITACDSNNNCLPAVTIQLFPPMLTGLTCDLTVSSGQPANCTVTISAAAPIGGFTVTLMSDPPLTVPASVTITAGSISATFQATAGTISTASKADITACDSNNNCPTATIQLMPPPSVTSLICDQSSLSTGQSTNCTVTISAPAPGVTSDIRLANARSSNAPVLRRGQGAMVRVPQLLRGDRLETAVKSNAGHDASGGVTVTLTSDNPLLPVLQSVTIPAGSTSVDFMATAGTIPPPGSTADITACDSGNGSDCQTFTIQLSTLTLTLTCDLSSLSSQQSTSCTITLPNSAPDGGAVVTLSSDNPQELPVPGSVTIPAGSTTTSFQATAGTISTADSATITGNYNSISQTFPIQLSPPSVTSLTCDFSSGPPILSSQQSTSCTVTISAAAPNATSATRLAIPRSSEAPLRLYGHDGPLERPAAAHGAKALQQLFSGRSETVVKSNVGRDTGAGVTIPLSSDNSLLTVPSSVTIPEGSTNTTFQAMAGMISILSSATITAGYSGSSQTFTIQLSPPPTTLSGLTCSPSSLSSGQSATCSVTLLTAAPAGGATVSLSSSTSAVLQVPPSVTVPAGSLSAAFSATVGTVSAASASTITANYNNTSQMSTVTVGGNALTAVPLSWTFTAHEGDTLSQTKSVSVFATTADNFTVSPSNANWLTVSPASGQTPGVVTVTVNPSGLAASPAGLTGTFTITGTNTAPASVTVSVSLLVLPKTPVLSVSPGFVNASALMGSATQQGQLVVSNTGGGTFNWTASQTGAAPCPAGVTASWLTVTGSGSATPASPGTAGFTLNPAGLAAGTYTATVQVSGNGQCQQVPVTLVVSEKSDTIALPQSGLEFDSVEKGPAPASQEFAVLSAGSGTMSWTATACTFSGTSNQCGTGSKWLQATPASGSSEAGSPFSVSVSVNPTVDPPLPAGDYFGEVQIVADQASNSPQVVTVHLHVLASGLVPPPSAPSGAVFVGTVGKANPPAQSYELTNAGAETLSFSSTVTTPSWLMLTPSSGTIPPGSETPVSLTVNTAGFAAGVQNGMVRVIFSDGTVREIGVALVVISSGASQTVGKAEPAGLKATTSSGCAGGLNVTLAGSSPPNLSDNDNVTVGVQQPLSVTVTNCNDGTVVTSSNGAVSVIVTQNGTPPLNFDLDYQGNGVWEAGWPVGNTTGQATVTITAFVFSLSSETQLSGSLPITVEVVQNSNTLVAQPTAVLNAASYPLTDGGQSPNNITPGSLAAIFGAQLAGQDKTAAEPFPTTLANVNVTLGGKSLPLNYVSPMQVNALIPWELNPGPNQLYVVRNGEQSNPIPVTVVDAQPAIFTTNARGTGQGAVLIANTATIAGTGNGEQPVPRGGYIEIYCTGLGKVTNTPEDGVPAPGAPSLAKTLITPLTVTIGGANAQVEFSGLAPGFVGLYQINAQVPSNAPTGSKVPIVVTVGNVQSPSGVYIAVQ